MSDEVREFDPNLPVYNLRNEANGLTNMLFYRSGKAKDITMAEAELVRDVIEEGLRDAFNAGADKQYKSIADGIEKLIELVKRNGT